MDNTDLSLDCIMGMANNRWTENTFHEEMIGETILKVNKIGDPVLLSLDPVFGID
jgi:hypothetical protein